MTEFYVFFLVLSAALLFLGVKALTWAGIQISENFKNSRWRRLWISAVVLTYASVLSVVMLARIERSG